MLDIGTMKINLLDFPANAFLRLDIHQWIDIVMNKLNLTIQIFNVVLIFSSLASRVLSFIFT